METKKTGTCKMKNQCNICNKVIIGSSFKFNSHLYQHKVVKSRYKCGFCSKEYFRRDVYDKHVSMHTGARKFYICDFCDRGYVDKRNLINHLKIHDDFLPMPRIQYKCKACGTSYCEERLLKYHIRKQHFNLKQKEPTHLNKMLNETWVERVRESEICVEMTKINNNIINIRKSLKTEKEDAVLGGKEKSKTSNFKEYMSSVFASKDQSHYSKAVCDYCNKEMLKKSLQSHIRERHLKLKRFKCEQCNVCFSRHYQLVNHICGKTRKRKRRRN